MLVGSLVLLVHIYQQQSPSSALHVLAMAGFRIKGLAGTDNLYLLRMMQLRFSFRESGIILV